MCLYGADKGLILSCQHIQYPVQSGQHKALCSERYRDWSTKFDALGVKCKWYLRTLLSA
jgi:hypothetical protein